MAYRSHLFDTGGFVGYGYHHETAKGKAKPNDADTSPEDYARFVDYHNNLRAAGANVVGIAAAAQNMFGVGARLANASNSSMPNYYQLQQISNSGDGPAAIARNFARTPFVSMRKEGGDGLILAARPISSTCAINPFDDVQERLFKKLFPRYTHPKDYQRIPGGFGNVAEPKWSFVSEEAGKSLEATISVDAFVNLLKGEFAAYLSPLISDSEEFEAVKTLPKGMGLSLTLRLRTDKARLVGMPITIASEGALPSSAAITTSVDIIPELHLPNDYALWTLYCEGKDEFVPFLFMTHMNSIVKAAAGSPDDKGKEPASFLKEMSGRQKAAWDRAKPRKPTPMSMARRNAKKEELTGYKPSVRTNPDGYLITAKNWIFRLPKEGKMVEYQTAANEWFEKLSDIEVTKMAEGGRDAPKFRFDPAVLMIDHHNEVMVYTTLEGKVTSEPLRGARPLDEITIAKIYPSMLRAVLNGHAFRWDDGLKGQLGWEGKTTFSLIHTLSNTQSDEYKAAADWFAIGACLPPTNMNPIMVKMEDHFWTQVQYAVRNATTYNSDQEMQVRTLINNARDGTIDEQTAAKQQLIGILNVGIRQIAAVTRKVWAEGEPKEVGGAVESNMESDTERYIVGVHTENIAKFHTQRQNNERDNIVDSLDRSKPLALPNIDAEKFSFAFPHQAEFIQATDELVPKAAVIGAAPGGGKTNSIIADILLLLAKGIIKRPVVCVPNNLIRQFCNEINEFTNGKINAFPFTYQHVRDTLMNPYGMNMDMPEVVKYIRDLPRNTILVTNYNTLKNRYTDTSLSEAGVYDQVNSYDISGQAKPLRSFPFVDILAAAGVDYVCGDESHKIKNQDGQMAQAFLTLCAKTDYIRLSSGTTINNVVTDLVGQMQKVNPAILGGDIKKFAEAFLGDEGARQVANADQADLIRMAIQEYALFMQKDSRSWDYMLPKMREVYHRVSLTPMQTRYYNILFTKAINLIREDSKIKADLAKIDKQESGKAKEGEVENQSKIDSKIEKAVGKHFSVIDRFVNSPNTFADFEDGSFVYEEYKLQHGGEEAPEGSLDPADVSALDLISVKAIRCYDLMYAHMREKGKLDQIQRGPNLDGIGGTPQWEADPTNKVIVMAPNKFVGNHVWDNLPEDLKRRSVRYVAGAFNKVEQFKEDDNIKFMIADEISIAEGHNLQVASRIIRMQQVWTPGGETQSLARIRRPDPFGKFDRASLGYDIIVATKPNGKATIDDLRIARLLAKKFNNAMVEFGFDQSFRNRFLRSDQTALPPVRMSMKIIQSFPEELLDQYFDQQQRFNTWFADSAKAQTTKMGREVEALTGKKLLDEAGNPINNQAFIQAVVVKTEEAPAIPGSAQSYVPWIPGVNPINPLKFDMQPIRSVTSVIPDDDADEEESDTELDKEDDCDASDDGGLINLDNVEVEPGDYVMTEFGPGIVEKDTRRGKGQANSAKLQIIIPGMMGKNGKPMVVRLAKTCVYVPLDDDGAKVLATAVKGKAGGPIKPPTKNPITQEQKNEARKRREGSKQPEPEVIDYDNDDEFEEDDFEISDLELDLTEDEDDEPENPIDMLIQGEDEDGEFEDDEEEEEDEDEAVTASIFAQALAVNGELAVIAYDSETDNVSGLDPLKTRYGFTNFPDLARVQFKTRKALDTFLARLAQAKFKVPSNLMAEIQTVAVGLTSHGKLKQVEPFNYAEVTNFMRTEQRMVPKKASAADLQVFRLYPMVTNGDFYLCASLKKHPFNVMQKLNLLAQGIPGTVKAQKRDNMGIKFYKNISEAKRDAKKIIADGDILLDPQAFLDSFDSIANGHIEMPKTMQPKTPPVDTNKPTRPPGAKPTPTPTGEKPKLKPSQASKPQGFTEETHNPAVEDLGEFWDFVRARRPTLVLVRTKNEDFEHLVGTPLRIVKFNAKAGWITVSPGPDASPDAMETLHPPDDATFDDNRGLMKTGSSVWRLSYAAKD